MSLCFLVLKLTQNYSVFVSSCFYLLLRPVQASFRMTILRDNNNYASTETYNTYNHKMSVQTAETAILARKLLFSVWFWIPCPTPAYFRSPNSYNQQRSYKDNSLKMWNIARKWRAVSPEQGQPCRASECLPPHLATVELRSRGLSGLHTSCFFGHLTQLGTSCRHFNSWTFVFCILTARKLREKKSPSKE